MGERKTETRTIVIELEYTEGQRGETFDYVYVGLEKLLWGFRGDPDIDVTDIYHEIGSLTDPKESIKKKVEKKSGYMESHHCKYSEFNCNRCRSRIKTNYGSETHKTGRCPPCRGVKGSDRLYCDIFKLFPDIEYCQTNCPVGDICKYIKR